MTTQWKSVIRLTTKSARLLSPERNPSTELDICARENNPANRNIETTRAISVAAISCLNVLAFKDRTTATALMTTKSAATGRTFRGIPETRITSRTVDGVLHPWMSKGNTSLNASPSA
ncbi:hypothetical protein D3C71_1848600 [compost metagenome]